MRTAVSAGSALRGPVAEAWVHDTGAPIVGESLVWDDVVVLELDLGEGKRALRGLDLLNGEKLLQTHARELTHHWLAVTGPLWRTSELRSSALSPGF